MQATSAVRYVPTRAPVHALALGRTLAQEAIRYYEPIVKKQADTILEVPAIVLANLCVSHIMISQNEEAEELMRKVHFSVCPRAMSVVFKVWQYLIDVKVEIYFAKL